MRCGVGVSDICGPRAVPVIKASVCHHQSCRVTVPRRVGRVADRTLHAPLLGARGGERVDGTGRVGGHIAASWLCTDVGWGRLVARVVDAVVRAAVVGGVGHTYVDGRVAAGAVVARADVGLPLVVRRGGSRCA